MGKKHLFSILIKIKSQLKIVNNKNSQILEIKIINLQKIF
jgi:hypothetical protein